MGLEGSTKLQGARTVERAQAGGSKLKDRLWSVQAERSMGSESTGQGGSNWGKEWVRSSKASAKGRGSFSATKAERTDAQGSFV